MNKRKGLLVISFGTSYKETRGKTIEMIEKDLAAAFPERKFYRAWTSGLVRGKIFERDGETICSPKEALDVILAEGIDDILIQPTHMLEGGEFGKIRDAIEPKMKQFKKAAVGRPILTAEEDVEEFAKKMIQLFSDVKEDEMAVFMGHGSDNIKLPVYEMLNDRFADLGRDNFCVGTVEFEPGIDPVLERVRRRTPKKVILSPLLVVAGDHAYNDMAGDEPDSWKNRIAAEGAEVECVLKGLGEYPEIRTMYTERAKEAEQETK